MSSFSHLDESGKPRMVDVGDKAISRRTATARGQVVFEPEQWDALQAGGFATKKGSVIDIAVIAGIQGVKQCATLIPLCHPLPVTGVNVNIQPGDHMLEITCTVKVDGKTGVEMEALTGVTIAALTVYDMCKAFGHGMRIEGGTLIQKTGGKSDVHRG